VGDKDEKDDDFIAVVDVPEGSATFGKVVATQPVGLQGSMPRHFEYQLPAPGKLLFANAHNPERLLAIDFSDPLHPRVAKTISPVPPYRFPHDITRLENAHILVGYLRSEGAQPGCRGR
jgi:hypothetical protein